MTETTKAEAEGAEADDDVEASRAPLLDHLIELRGRLIRSLIAVGLAFAVCFFFAEQIFAFLVQPLANALTGDPDRRMIFTALQEAFFTYVRVGLFGGLCLAFPYVAYQLWRFIAPGLYKTERRAFLPFIVATPVLFVLGASLVYFLVMPLAVRFFLGFETPGAALPIELEARVSQYLNLIMLLMFAFGLCFQLPVLLTLMARVGLISSGFLRRNRKYAIVLVFVAAAVLTPPDPISQLGLGIPVLLLYEISILAVRLVEKDQAKARAKAGG